MEYRGFYISRTEDCEENEGGFFCQIYTDENFDNEIDYFCIRKQEIENIDDLIIKYIDYYFAELSQARKLMKVA